MEEEVEGGRDGGMVGEDTFISLRDCFVSIVGRGEIGARGGREEAKLWEWACPYCSEWVELDRPVLVFTLDGKTVSAELEEMMMTSLPVVLLPDWVGGGGFL